MDKFSVRLLNNSEHYSPNVETMFIMGKPRKKEKNKRQLVFKFNLDSLCSPRCRRFYQECWKKITGKIEKITKIIIRAWQKRNAGISSCDVRSYRAYTQIYIEISIYYNMWSVALIWSASHGSALSDSNSSHKLSLENVASFLWWSLNFIFCVCLFLSPSVICHFNVHWMGAWSLIRSMGSIFKHFFLLLCISCFWSKYRFSFSIINMNNNLKTECPERLSMTLSKRCELKKMATEKKTTNRQYLALNMMKFKEMSKKKTWRYQLQSIQSKRFFSSVFTLRF